MAITPIMPAIKDIMDQLVTDYVKEFKSAESDADLVKMLDGLNGTLKELDSEIARTKSLIYYKAALQRNNMRQKA